MLFRSAAARRPSAPVRRKRSKHVPIARARSLDGDRNTFRPRRIAKRGNVLHPGLLVEISGEEPARLVRQHGIDTGGKVSRISGRSAGKMGPEGVIAERDEGLIWALPALDLRLSANASNPLVPAQRRITCIAGLWIFPSARQDIFPAAEQVPEQRDLRGGWRSHGDGSGGRWQPFGCLSPRSFQSA